ncbi:MAG: hypothetical protein JRE61_15635, partial [Deltaproteobacteria bacterium]|nr:hypothetical protein [Deltaproteobacteria bacterium]
FYVLSPEAVARILKQLGHRVEDPIELLKKNYEYYEQRTSHGSTLSKVVHAVISSYMAEEKTAWEWFMEAMRSDRPAPWMLLRDTLQVLIFHIRFRKSTRIFPITGKRCP